MKSQWIEEKVRQKGYKITKPRDRIFSYLETSGQIFCAADIINALSMVDRVSVYRTIELLESMDIIHKTVQLDGQQYYELHGDTHHHHIICTECKDTACIDCVLPPAVIPGFSEVHHAVTFTGKCVSCAN